SRAGHGETLRGGKLPAGQSRSGSVGGLPGRATILFGGAAHFSGCNGLRVASPHHTRAFPRAGQGVRAVPAQSGDLLPPDAGAVLSRGGTDVVCAMSGPSWRSEAL